MIKKAIVLLPILLWTVGLVVGEKNLEKRPVDYADPNIGRHWQLLTATVPYVQWPHVWQGSHLSLRLE